MSATAEDGLRRKPLVYRWALAAIGIVAVFLGGVGVFVPGLPTTVFLIIATYCFARSCPWLEQRLLRRRLFAPYMTFVDGGAPMPPRVRVITLLVMWTSVCASLVVLSVTGRLGPWIAGAIVSAAAAGTLAILAAGRRRSRQTIDTA